MKTFTFKLDCIPEEHKDDIKRLNKFLQESLDIFMGYVDIYMFWNCVSKSVGVSWIEVPEELTDSLRIVLLAEIEKYGNLAEF